MLHGVGSEKVTQVSKLDQQAVDVHLVHICRMLGRLRRTSHCTRQVMLEPGRRTGNTAANATQQYCLSGHSPHFTLKRKTSARQLRAHLVCSSPTRSCLQPTRTRTTGHSICAPPGVWRDQSYYAALTRTSKHTHAPSPFCSTDAASSISPTQLIYSCHVRICRIARANHHVVCSSTAVPVW